MIRVILHIGRHKTGTTSLQRALYNNDRLLREKGFLYPHHYIRGYGHHALANALERGRTKKMGSRELRSSIEKCRGTLIDIMQDDSLHYVISSESFQNADPKVIKQLFCQNLFDVKLVCYFREQVSYMASAYNQKTHATTYDRSVKQFHSTCFSANYWKFANIWANQFPDYYFNLFQPANLVAGDVVQDFFLRVLDFSAPTCHGAGKDNISLSRHVLAAKRAINRKVNQGEIEISLRPSDYYIQLARIRCGEGDGNFRLNHKLARKVEKVYKKGNRKFLVRYLPGLNFAKYAGEIAETRENQATDFDITVLLKKIATAPVKEKERLIHNELRLLMDNSHVGYSKAFGRPPGSEQCFADDRAVECITSNLAAETPFYAAHLQWADGGILMLRKIFKYQLISSWAVDAAFHSYYQDNCLQDHTKVALSHAFLRALDSADLMTISNDRVADEGASSAGKVNACEVGWFALCDYLYNHAQSALIGSRSMKESAVLWKRILSGRRVSIVATRNGFDKALASMLGIKVGKTFFLPEQLPEVYWRFGEERAESTEYSFLAQTLGTRDRTGQIFLVGSDILSKIAGKRVKEQGGIALSIDPLMGGCDL